MPTPTYTPLANITLGSAQATISITSISGLYRDLVLVFDGTTSNSGTSKVMVANLNGTGTSGSKVEMYATSSSYSSDTDAELRIGRLSGSGGKGVTIAHFMDYTATDKHTTILSRSSYTASATDRTPTAIAARWANTAAVTSIVLSELTGDTFAAGSTLALYGIASA